MNLDHVVIVVAELEQAIADYQALGFTVSPGGEHADGRTHNALVPFADGTYLELIAFRPGVDAGDHPWSRLAAAGGGLVDWALQTDDLAQRLPAVRDAGLPFEGPFDGGRTRPDGIQLRWRATRPAPAYGLPFLIEDVTDRALRVPGGAAAAHPNGAQAIECVIVAIADLAVAARQYAHLLGVPAPEPTPDPLHAAMAVTLPCGQAEVTLAAASAGPLHERLLGRGPGPYALHMRTDGERTGWLDEQQAHGVPLRLQP